MKIHISYSNPRFQIAQESCAKSARENGGFDVSFSLSEINLDPGFRQANQHILQQPRGAGFWLWKPYVIQQSLQNMNYGDVLVYTDSAMVFVKPIWPAIDRYLQDNKIGIVSTGMCGYNGQLSKRDAFIKMGLDSEEYRRSNQKTASCVVIKYTEHTMEFVNEWLRYCTDEEIITDCPNKHGENYPEFMEHRHDQSVFSLLCHKHSIIHCSEGLCQFHRPTDPYIFHHRNPSFRLYNNPSFRLF